jgi:hypothetical protein
MAMGKNPGHATTGKYDDSLIATRPIAPGCGSSKGARSMKTLMSIGAFLLLVASVIAHAVDAACQKIRDANVKTESVGAQMNPTL